MDTYETAYAATLAKLRQAGYAKAHVQADLAGVYLVVPLDHDDAGDGPFVYVAMLSDAPDGYADLPAERAAVVGWQLNLNSALTGYAGISAETNATTDDALVLLVAAVFAGVSATN